MVLLHGMKSINQKSFIMGSSEGLYHSMAINMGLREMGCIAFLCLVAAKGESCFHSSFPAQ